MKKRKEADVVAPGASDRGSRVGLDGEVQGSGAGLFHAMPACPPAHPLWAGGTQVSRYPDPCGVGLPDSCAAVQAGLRVAVTAAAANDSKSVTENGIHLNPAEPTAPLFAEHRRRCFRGCSLPPTPHSQFRFTAMLLGCLQDRRRRWVVGRGRRIGDAVAQ